MKKATEVFLPFNAWGFSIHKPLIISGPCAVETEKQIHETADALARVGVQILRGGIWKPRTRPDSFQGIGAEGLRWLKNAGQKNKLPVMVEVANPNHVQFALKANIDILWIGARTTVNPFLIQEIADSLHGVNIPVMIKNPINPDIDLWVGAIERIYKTGINRIAAIHRGFSSYEKSKYRNVPNWEIPIELRRRYPQLPIVCDPSHICGSKELIFEVAQTALDLNFEGLMIESHINPNEALSDKAQQLTPDELSAGLNSLVVRSATVDDVLFNSLLEELRHKIDGKDEEILNLISERMKIAREIGQYKKENNMTILQLERWNEIFTTRLRSGLNMELTGNFIVKLFEIIHQESIHQQTVVMNSPSVEEKTGNN